MWCRVLLISLLLLLQASKLPYSEFKWFQKASFIHYFVNSILSLLLVWNVGRNTVADRWSIWQIYWPEFANKHDKDIFWERLERFGPFINEFFHRKLLFNSVQGLWYFNTAPPQQLGGFYLEHLKLDNDTLWYTFTLLVATYDICMCVCASSTNESMIGISASFISH